MRHGRRFLGTRQAVSKQFDHGSGCRRRTIRAVTDLVTGRCVVPAVAVVTAVIADIVALTDRVAFA